jgi:hypothetical protein
MRVNAIESLLTRFIWFLCAASGLSDLQTFTSWKLRVKRIAQLMQPFLALSNLTSNSHRPGSQLALPLRNEHGSKQMESTALAIDWLRIRINWGFGSGA